VVAAAAGGGRVQIAKPRRGVPIGPELGVFPDEGRRGINLVVVVQSGVPIRQADRRVHLRKRDDWCERTGMGEYE